MTTPILLEQEWYKKLSSEQKAQILEYAGTLAGISADIIRKYEAYRRGLPENKHREMDRFLAQVKSLLPETLKQKVFAELNALERLSNE